MGRQQAEVVRFLDLERTAVFTNCSVRFLLLFVIGTAKASRNWVTIKVLRLGKMVWKKMEGLRDESVIDRLQNRIMNMIHEALAEQSSGNHWK